MAGSKRLLATRLPFRTHSSPSTRAHRGGPARRYPVSPKVEDHPEFVRGRMAYALRLLDHLDVLRLKGYELVRLRIHQAFVSVLPCATTPAGFRDASTFELFSAWASELRGTAGERSVGEALDAMTEEQCTSLARRLLAIALRNGG